MESDEVKQQSKTIVARKMLGRLRDHVVRGKEMDRKAVIKAIDIIIGYLKDGD